MLKILAICPAVYVGKCPIQNLVLFRFVYCKADALPCIMHTTCTSVHTNAQI